MSAVAAPPASGPLADPVAAAPAAPTSAAMARPGPRAKGAPPQQRDAHGTVLPPPPRAPIVPPELPRRVRWENHRQTLKERADDDSRWRCEVCMRDDSLPGNLIIMCEGCFVCVHQLCYGVEEVPAGDFYCQPCVLGLVDTPPACVFCPNKGGAMKRTTPVAPGAPDRWAHLSCSLWLPSVVIGDPDRWEGIHAVSTMPENEGRHVPAEYAVAEAQAAQNASEAGRTHCRVCGGSGGVLAACAADHCGACFHVTCAQRQGYPFVIAFDDSAAASGGKAGPGNPAAPAAANPPSSSSSSSSAPGKAGETADADVHPLAFRILCDGPHPWDRAAAPAAAADPSPADVIAGLAPHRLPRRPGPCPGGLFPADADTLRAERTRLAWARQQDAEDAAWQSRADDVARPLGPWIDLRLAETAVLASEALFEHRETAAPPRLREAMFRHDLEAFHAAYGPRPLRGAVEAMGGASLRPGGPDVDLYRLYREVRSAVWAAERAAGRRPGSSPQGYGVLLHPSSRPVWDAILARCCGGPGETAAGAAAGPALTMQAAAAGGGRQGPPSSSSSSSSSSAPTPSTVLAAAPSPPGGFADADYYRLLALYRRLLFPLASYLRPAGGWRTFVSPLLRLLVRSAPTLTRTALNGGARPPEGMPPAGAVLPRSAGRLLVRCPHGPASGRPASLLGCHGEAGDGASLAQLWQHVRETNPALDLAAAAAAAEARSAAAAAAAADDAARAHAAADQTAAAFSSSSSSSSSAAPAPGQNASAAASPGPAARRPPTHAPGSGPGSASAALGPAVGPAARERARAAAAIAGDVDDEDGALLVRALLISATSAAEPWPEPGQAEAVATARGGGGGGRGSWGGEGGRRTGKRPRFQEEEEDEDGARARPAGGGASDDEDDDGGGDGGLEEGEIPAGMLRDAADVGAEPKRRMRQTAEAALGALRQAEGTRA